MKRSPTSACRGYFREGRSSGERRRPRRQDAIDTEILAPMFRRDIERLADEDCVGASCIDEKLALDTQRSIDDERSDQSIFIALDDSSLRLVAFDGEWLQGRLEM